MFTNKAVEKERKKQKIFLWVGILSVIIMAIFMFYGNKKVDESEQNKDTMHNVIIKEKEDERTGKKAYLNVHTTPYKFAVYNDTTDAYYFVMDDKYMYVAYMTTADYNMLNKENIETNPVKVEGVTEKTPDDIKKLAIDAYNEAMENEEDKLTINDFDNYFGSIYLDMTPSNDSIGGFYYCMGFIFGVLGIFMFIIFIIYNIRFKKGIKKLDSNEIMKIDMEMNDPEAFYYEKAHLYLTKNYIVNFAGTFNVTYYKDIIWMYPFITRTNGIKTSQSIMVVTKDGKRKNVADIDCFTKGKKEIFDEIFNTIASKNDKIIIGYDKESQMKAKELLNSIKLRK